MNSLYQPYQQFQYQAPQSQPPSPVLPPQQVVQVNGKTSVDSIRMSPNSSILVMDTTSPIVWMCISDGIGNVTSIAYDITPHKEMPPVDVSSLESRIANIENMIKEIKDAESNDAKPVNKQNETDTNANQKYDEFG